MSVFCELIVWYLRWRFCTDWVTHCGVGVWPAPPHPWSLLGLHPVNFTLRQTQLPPASLKLHLLLIASERRFWCLPEGAGEVGESGSGVRLIGPTLGEHGVHCGGAELRFGESDTWLQLVNHLAVLQPEEWLLCHWEDLPHTHACIQKYVQFYCCWSGDANNDLMFHTKHPDIARCGETSEVDGFRCHPFDR